MSWPFPASHGIEGISLLIAGFLLLAAAIQDVRKFKIANGFSIALALLFPVYAIAADISIWPHLLTGVIVFGVGFGLFALRLLGGGDVKLISAAALWAGPQFILVFLIATTAIGGILSLFCAMMALAKSRKKKGKRANEKAIPWQKAPVPYGMAIACGGWIVLVNMAQRFLA
jgi:prepilin peptidase CpaA